MNTRRLALWGHPGPDSASRRPGRVPDESERLVRLRAAGRCEACRADLGGGGTCGPVYIMQAWNGDNEDSGPANTLLLCAECRALVEALDTRMEARGIWAWSGPGPRQTPMIVPSDDGSWRPVWRSGDGRYLFDPPDDVSPWAGTPGAR
jgi:hypothetical protein